MKKKKRITDSMVVPADGRPEASQGRIQNYQNKIC